MGHDVEVIIDLMEDGDDDDRQGVMLIVMGGPCRAAMVHNQEVHMLYSQNLLFNELCNVWTDGVAN